MPCLRSGCDIVRKENEKELDKGGRKDILISGVRLNKMVSSIPDTIHAT